MSGDGRPLAGRSIVVTRAEDQAEPLVAALRALGAEPLVVPAIRTVPATDSAGLDAAARALAGVRWLGFTSPAGVRYGWSAVARAWPGGLPEGLAVAAVGPGTAEALRDAGARADWTPAEATGDAFAAELPVRPGERVVLLRSDIARRAVAERLRARGADVTDVAAYQTLESADPAAVAAALDARPAAVLFASPSAVRGFLAALDNPARLRGVRLLPIGPTTAAALADAGLRAAAVPERSTLDGLLDALVRLSDPLPWTS